MPQSNGSRHLIANMEKGIMACYFFGELVVTNGSVADPVQCQVLRQQDTPDVFFLEQLEAKCVVIVFRDILYLNQSKCLCTIHHGQLPDVIIAVDHGPCHHSRAGDQAIHRRIAIVEFGVFMVREYMVSPMHEVQLPVQLLRDPQIIGIKEGNPFSPGFPEGPVPGHSRSDITRVFEIADARVIEGRNDTVSMVRRPVVHDNQLPVGISLGQDRSNGFGDESAGIPRWHDD